MYNFQAQSTVRLWHLGTSHSGRNCYTGTCCARKDYGWRWSHHWTPWTLLNTIGHCGYCYQDPTILKAKAMFSELSTMLNRYWQLWYNKQCSWGNRWYQNTLRTLRIGTIMVSWWLLNMVTDNTGKVQVWYCSSGRILLAADNTGQEARQPLRTPHCSGVKNVKNTKTSLLRN